MAPPTRAGAAASAKGQTTLDEKLTKRVNFKETEKDSKKDKEKSERQKDEDFKNTILDEVRKIRQEKLEIEKMKLDLNAVTKELGERIDRLEKIVRDREEKEREWEELQSVKSTQSGVSFAETARGGATGSMWSLVSGRSGVSVKSGMSLSEREVVKMKKIVYDQDRLERKNNIVIRGVEAEGSNLKEWVVNWLEAKLEVNATVEYARKSGPVIVAKVGEHDKSEIMKKKSILRGTRIFIENDLNVDDRKKQEEIHRWVKERRGEGWMVKSGTGRVFYKNVWRRWEEKEEIEEEMEKEKSDNGKNRLYGSHTKGRGSEQIQGLD